MNEIDQKLDELADEWGQVYIVHRGSDYRIANPVVVRNKTDEGLPIDGERIVVGGMTLEEAVNSAYEEYVE